MKTLTVTNKRVQFYLTYSTEKPGTALKKQRLKQLEGELEKQNIMIDELFPAKQLQVLDYLLYITSGTGIAKVGAERIAEKCGCSVRTVYSAVKALKQTNEFIVARLIKSRGGAGKYVLVDKKHSHFNEIMAEVFMLSAEKIAQLNTEQIAEQSAPKNTAEHLMYQSFGGNNKTSNLNNYLKHTKEIYISESIKNEIEKENNNCKEYLLEYTSNSYQIGLYDFLTNFPLPKSMDEIKGLLALRIGSNATIKTFTRAKSLIVEMAKRIQNGYQYENIIAAFTTGLAKAMQYDIPIEFVEEKTQDKKVSSVKFYDWLNIRE